MYIIYFLICKTWWFLIPCKDRIIFLCHNQPDPWYDHSAVWLTVAQGVLAAPNLYRLKPVLLSRRIQKHLQHCFEDRVVPIHPSCTYPTSINHEKLLDYLTAKNRINLNL